MIEARIDGTYVPCSLPEALAGPYPRAHTILSLYDMYKFYVFTLLVFCRQLEQLFGLMSFRDPIDDALRTQVEEMLVGIKEECQRYNLPARADQADRVIRFVRGGLDGHALTMLGRELMNGIQDDLRTFVLLAIPSADRTIFEKIQMSEEAQNKFPSIIKDMDEAGKCLALERNSACVFHLMRALEVTLHSLAKALGVSFERRQWENIINDIEKTIHSPKPNDEQRFYSEAAIQFRHFKSAWRNHVIHNPIHYDRSDTAIIFTAVRDFVCHLATRLSE